MSQERKNAALKDICYGSTAGMISKVFEHPFDLVKVRLQSQPLPSILPLDGSVLEKTANGRVSVEPFKGPIDCAVRTVKNEGFEGLYRGLSMPVLGAMLENATLFYVYRSVLAALTPSQNTASSQNSPNNLPPQPPLPHLLLASSLAGLSASFVLTPIELIKCRLQVQMLSQTSSLPPSLSNSNPTLRPPGPVQMARTVWLEEGIRGLWRGQTGTLIRETGGGAAWFTVFNYAKSFFISRHPSTPLSTPELLASGAMAGVAYNVSFFPADCIKSAIQTEEELNGRKGKVSSTFWGKGKEIWKARGIGGLYAGMGVTVVRSAPSSAIIWLVYEKLESRFG